MPPRCSAASACVQTGKTFNLSIPLDDNGPQIGFIPGRYNPIHKVFQINEVTIGDPDGTRFSDDQMDLALQACTHWDALSHSSYGGNLWNGHPADSITESGAGKCGIGLVTSLVTRGVLLDVARLKGVDVVEAGTPLTGADLDAACEAAGVTVEPGDVVLLRTGAMSLFLAGDRGGLRVDERGTVAAERRLVPRPRRRRGRHRQPDVRVRRVRALGPAAGARPAPRRDGDDAGPELEPRGARRRLRGRRPVHVPPLGDARTRHRRHRRTGRARRGQVARAVKFIANISMCDASFYVPLAQAAEQAGFDTIAVPDSIAYPKESSSTYPYNFDGTREFLENKPFIEPHIAIAAMAAVTSSDRVPHLRAEDADPSSGDLREGSDVARRHHR